MKTGFDRVIHLAPDHTRLGYDPEAPALRFRTLAGRQLDRRHGARRRVPVRRETPGQAYERRRASCHRAHVRAKAALRELEMAIGAAERRYEELELRLARADRRAEAVRRRVA